MLDISLYMAYAPSPAPQSTPWRSRSAKDRDRAGGKSVRDPAVAPRQCGGACNGIRHPLVLIRGGNASMGMAGRAPVGMAAGNSIPRQTKKQASEVGSGRKSPHTPLPPPGAFARPEGKQKAEQAIRPTKHPAYGPVPSPPASRTQHARRRRKAQSA
jgi:hypothetical protein